jgi:hypothetical protein
MTTAEQIRERPIIFNADMVRAILDGHKTQTRRLVKPQPNIFGPSDASWFDAKSEFWRNSSQYARDCCPFGSVGDRLWVREAFDIVNDPAAYAPGRKPPRLPEGCGEYDAGPYKKRGPNGERWVVDYAADKNTRVMDIAGQRKWTPSIHMPRWASRITLEILSVRIERLQKITEADAKVEGVMGLSTELMQDAARRVASEGSAGAPSYQVGPIDYFRQLWDRLYGKKPGCAWADSPYVWVISFRRVA